MRQSIIVVGLIVCLQAVSPAAQNQSGTLRVQVRAEDKPVEKAEVLVAGGAHQTDASGTAQIRAPVGEVELTVVKSGYVTTTAKVTVTAGGQQDVTVDLQPEPTLEETVTVVATTRTNKRLEDQPMRVEVLAREEIEETMLMTPGDIVMMLNEMGGMRVQATSPSLGAASVRIQGMRGRCTRCVVRRTAALRRSRRTGAAADPAHGSRAGRSGERASRPRSMVPVRWAASSICYRGVRRRSHSASSCSIVRRGERLTL